MRISPGSVRLILTALRNSPRFKNLPFLVLFPLLVAHAPSQTQSPAQPQNREFFTAKDRQLAIRNATIYSPKPVAEADIVQGPEQEKDLFQLHFNDKVICDFATPGSQMGGKTQKFGCKIARVEKVEIFSSHSHQLFGLFTENGRAFRVPFGASLRRWSEQSSPLLF